MTETTDHELVGQTIDLPIAAPWLMKAMDITGTTEAYVHKVRIVKGRLDVLVTFGGTIDPLLGKWRRLK